MILLVPVFLETANSVSKRRQSEEGGEEKRREEKRCHLRVLASSNLVFVLFISITVSCRDHMSEEEEEEEEGDEEEEEEERRRRDKVALTLTLLFLIGTCSALIHSESGPAESICKVNVACEQRDERVQSVVTVCVCMYVYLEKEQTLRPLR